VTHSADTIPQTGGAAKDRDLHFSVPPPGDELVGVVQDHAEQVPASSVWHAFELRWLIPRLTDGPLPSDDEGDVLKPWALEVTRTGSDVAYGHTLPREREKLRFLALAAQRDLLGISENQQARMWHYGLNSYDDKSRQARDAAASGRELWRRLQAWPWCVCPPGKLPVEWWLLPEVRSAFGAWSEIRGARIRIRSMKDGREVF
jgi:hypothetical protein